MTQDQNTLVDFTAADGEQVTVTVMPVSFQRAVVPAARYAGQQENPVGATPPYVFQFTCSRGGADVAGQAAFYCNCDFNATDPWFANYTFQLTGSKGGNYTAPSVVNPNQSVTVVFNFEIH
jgi:hypothetical protein